MQRNEIYLGIIIFLLILMGIFLFQTLTVLVGIQDSGHNIVRFTEYIESVIENNNNTNEATEN